MANDCCGTMRVVAKNKEAIDRFERIMRYKDDEFFCYRVFQFEKFDEYKDGEFYVAEFSTDVAWGSDKWFYDADRPEKKIITGYEKTRRIVRPDSSEEMCEDYEKPIHGTAHYTSVRHLCGVLGIGVELWTTEPGMCFEEHADCDRNGDFHYETAEYREEYEDGEDGEPTEVHGFGDEYMEFMYANEIYDHEN